MKEKFRKINKISNFKVLAICMIIVGLVMYYYEEVEEVDVKLPSQEVVVLKDNVPENIVIEENMISIERRFEDKFLKDGNIVKSYNEIVGKRTKVPLYEGELINRDRLLDNQEYMDEDSSQRQISFPISDIDQALNLKKGDYMDLWIIPKSEESKLNTNKIFEKLQIIEIVNTDKQIINDGEKSESSELAIYVVLQLTDEQIAELFSIDTDYNEIKISKYKENDYYSIVNEKFEKGPIAEKEGDKNEPGTN